MSFLSSKWQQVCVQPSFEKAKESRGGFFGVARGRFGGCRHTASCLVKFWKPG